MLLFSPDTKVFSKVAPIELNILSFLDETDLAAVSEVTPYANKMTNLIQSIQRLPQLRNKSPLKLEIAELSGGLTNVTYRIEIDGVEYVLRYPGAGSDHLVDRKHEAANVLSVQRLLKLNVNVFSIDGSDGLQLSQYLTGCETVTKELISANPDILRMILAGLKALHHSKPFVNTVNPLGRNRKMFKALNYQRIVAYKYVSPVAIGRIDEIMTRLEAVFSAFIIEHRPCHNDTIPINFLTTKDRSEIRLIDWEYSGNNDPLFDLVYFGMNAQLDDEQMKALLVDYYQVDSEDMMDWVRCYEMIIHWWVVLWSWTKLETSMTESEKAKYVELAERHYKFTVDLLTDKTTLAHIEALEMKVKDATPAKKLRRAFNA